MCVAPFVQGDPLRAQGWRETNPFCRSRVLSLDNVTVTDIIAKEIMKEFTRYRGRNLGVYVEDGDRGVRSLDVHQLEQKHVANA